MVKRNQKLTDQQSAFVDAYLVNFSKQRAVIEAGYQTKSPNRLGWELCQKPHIKAELEKRAQEFSDRQNALKARILEELCAIAFSDLSDVGRFGPSGIEFNDHDQIPPDTKRAIAELTVNENANGINCKVRFHNKTQALELLGKHLMMFKEDKQVAVNVTPYIIKRRDGSEVELGVNAESD